MKSLIPALTLTACLAIAPAWAAGPGQQDPSGDATYAPMFAYLPTNPHGYQMPKSVEQAAERKAAAAERAELAEWSSIMGTDDIPQEYLSKPHN